MINHPFIPGDIDEDFCENCDRTAEEHVNIEGIVHEDEVFDFGPSIFEIKEQYAYAEEAW